VTIFGQIVSGAANLMMTDAIETRLQQRLHPQLCAVHPDAPFDHAEKAILLPRDDAFKAFVDQWLGHASTAAAATAPEHWRHLRGTSSRCGKPSTSACYWRRQWRAPSGM
jgi:hypothetical protein